MAICMRYILTIGLGLLALGLNLMMVWKMLTITREETAAAVAKIKSWGIRVIITGCVVIVAGAFVLLRINHFEGGAMLATGGYVALLGIFWIIGLVSRGREKCLKKGALFVVGIGGVLILTYSVYNVVVNVIPLF